MEQSYYKPNLGRLLAETIKKHPNSQVLLYKEAKLLVEKRLFSSAVAIIRTLLQLIPSCLEIWMLLVEIFILKEDYINALMSLNTICFSIDFSQSEGNEDYLKNPKEVKLQNPKKK